MPLSAAWGGELVLPEGFSASVFHEGVGSNARHLAISADGDVYIRKRSGSGLIALSDSDGDGVSDRTEILDEPAGTGIEIREGYLYFSSTTAVYRYQLAKGKLLPQGPRETVVMGLPARGSHAAKSLSFGADGDLFVDVGAPSNACQKEDRKKDSPGQRPCPLLHSFAGVWRFEYRGEPLEFTQDGERFATGMRNAVALEWNPIAKSLFLVQHGRDQLGALYPEHYTMKESAELPAEEFHRVEQGSNIGWPYTYWNQLKGKRIIAPEYGGNGKKESQKEGYQDPLIGFPGHWAPNDLIFYTGDSFPEWYQGAAFIAFHGSWNRAPFPQQGYKVVAVPMEGPKVSGDWSTFADGFKGREEISYSGQADFRPMGLAVGPKGALFISDSQKGRIWKVEYSAPRES